MLTATGEAELSATSERAPGPEEKLSLTWTSSKYEVSAF